MTRPRIVLIHATPVAIEPIRQAMVDHWPEAEAVNLLDDSLTPDRAATREMTDALSSRFVQLAHYGLAIGAQGILVTCSAFGPAIERAAAAMLAHFSTSRAAGLCGERTGKPVLTAPRSAVIRLKQTMA